MLPFGFLRYGFFQSIQAEKLEHVRQVLASLHMNPRLKVRLTKKTSKKLESIFRGVGKLTNLIMLLQPKPNYNVSVTKSVYSLNDYFWTFKNKHEYVVRSIHL